MKQDPILVGGGGGGGDVKQSDTSGVFFLPVCVSRAGMGGVIRKVNSH